MSDSKASSFYLNLQWHAAVFPSGAVETQEIADYLKTQSQNADVPFRSRSVQGDYGTPSMHLIRIIFNITNNDYRAGSKSL